MQKTVIITKYPLSKLLIFILPVALLLSIALLLHNYNSLSVKGYIAIQKTWFLFINGSLVQYPELLLNLTQLGDALIFLSFLSILIIYTPKVWESILTGSLFSLVFSVTVKETFTIPRPAAAFSDIPFNIIGEKLSASNSFPSGHSITIFTILTILMIAFTPKKIRYQVIYFPIVISIGLLFAITRVAVGAHYPLDVIVGCILGFICGLLGTYISQKYRIWLWFYNKKYYPVFITLFIICSISLIFRILENNLLIHSLALISLGISIYKMISIYVKDSI